MQNMYMKANNNLSRIANSSRSPVVALSTEISKGVVAIRAFKKQKYYKGEIRKVVNQNVKYFPLVNGFKAAYTFWVEILNQVFLTIPAIGYIIWKLNQEGETISSSDIEIYLLFVTNA